MVFKDQFHGDAAARTAHCPAISAHCHEMPAASALSRSLPA
jgi:hypothetical protein